jgi:acetoin utilization protein AcuB
MRISAWMKHPVHHVKPRDSVAHARALMERHRVNQLPVMADGRLVGLVSDRDLRDAFPSAIDTSGPPGMDGAPEHIAVEEVMTRNVLTLAPGDLLEQAARLMRRERIGAIPIVDGGRLVGILSRSDVLDAFVAFVGALGHQEADEPRGRAAARR